MAIPLQVCLTDNSVKKLVDDTLPVPTPPATAKVPGQYTCFTTVALHLDGAEWVVQNMPIHRWLLDKVFTVSDLNALGVTVAATKQLQYVKKPNPNAPAARDPNQSATATVPVGVVKRGSKARQGKRIRFGLKGTLANNLAGAIAAKSAPKSFGKKYS